MSPKSPFKVRITGDLSNTEGKPAGNLGLDQLQPASAYQFSFLEDQVPKPNDPTYKDRMYSMEITPAHVASANLLMVCRPYVRATAFAQGARGLVGVARAGIGYDKIDLEACTANDVVVFNTPHGMTHSTASAAMLLILALSKRLHLQLRILREYRWDDQRTAVGDDLAGMTLGIIGLGKTGRELARLIAPFGMRILAFSRHTDPAEARQLGIELAPSLDDLLKRSDYVSLHGKLDQTTRGMLGERELSLMKPTAFLVNVARGEMLDEPALVRILQQKRIAGAGLDVFDHEPLPLEHPLMKLDNVILTPHWLCSTRQAGLASAKSLMQDISSVAHGEVPGHVLNPEVINRPGFREKLQRHRIA